MRDNNAAAGRISADEYRLDLHSVINDIWDQKLAVVLLTIAAVLLSFVLFGSSISPTYVTKATVAVRSAKEDPSVNNTLAYDVNSAMKNAGDCAIGLKAVMDGSAFKTAAAGELEGGYFRSSISTIVIGATNVIEISATASSPEVSFREARAVVDYLTEAQDELMGGVRITLIQEPQVREQPTNGGVSTKLALAVGFLAFFGMCTLLAWYSSSKYTVRNSREVSGKLGTELLATVPHVKRKGGAAGILITDPSVSPRFSEEMRSLAVRLINEMEQDGFKTLLVAGAMDGEGKSTAAANIALAMSEMNWKVILADMDFQKPSLAKILNMQDGNFTDFTQFLESTKASETAGAAENSGAAAGGSGLITKVPGTELSVLLNRKADPKAMDRYAGQVRKCLEMLRNEADLVIIDTSSMDSVSDAEELASMTDASVLVVRENYAPVKEIVSAVEALSSKGCVLGCAFNNARSGVETGRTAQGNGGHYVG